MYKIESPPRTIMEVYKSLPEGTLAELINGSIVMSPSPNVNHQDISISISAKLYMYVTEHSLGKILEAPFDVFLDDNSTAVQPDILFVASERTEIVKYSGVYGAPDLIIEILSPGNPDHDLVTKKDLYERFGVKEYWIVDPDSKLTRGFVLRNGKFDELVSREGEIQSIILNHKFLF